MRHLQHLSMFYAFSISQISVLLKIQILSRIHFRNSIYSLNFEDLGQPNCIPKICSGLFSPQIDLNVQGILIILAAYCFLYYSLR